MSGETDWLLPFLGCVIIVLALLIGVVVMAAVLPMVRLQEVI